MIQTGIIVARDVGGGWVCATGLPGNWVSSRPVRAKRAIVNQALEAILASNITFDLTISSEPASKVLENPDVVVQNSALNIFCPERKKDRERWASLALEASGVFALAKIVAGGAVPIFLKDLAEYFSEEHSGHEALFVRPDWIAYDLLPATAKETRR